MTRIRRLKIQNRARDHLAKLEAEQDAKRIELGVQDEVKDVPAVTTAMLVKLGENDVKSVEDLAGCANRRSHRLERSARTAKP